MGNTIRRQPITNSIPAAPDYQFLNVLNFEGLNMTDNPFTADVTTASDCLNVYVDEVGALTTRPRLELFYDLHKQHPGMTKLLGVYPLSIGYLFHYIENGSYALDIAYAVDNTLTFVNVDTYTHGVNPKVDKLSVFEQNDKIYILSGEGYYFITYEIMEDIIIRAEIDNVEGYVPTTRVGKNKLYYDKETDTYKINAEGTSFEALNLFSDTYKESYFWDGISMLPDKSEALSVENSYYTTTVDDSVLQYYDILNFYTTETLSNKNNVLLLIRKSDKKLVMGEFEAGSKDIRFYDTDILFDYNNRVYDVCKNQAKLITYSGDESANTGVLSLYIFDFINYNYEKKDINTVYYKSSSSALGLNKIVQIAPLGNYFYIVPQVIYTYDEESEIAKFRLFAITPSQNVSEVITDNLVSTASSDGVTRRFIFPNTTTGTILAVVDLPVSVPTYTTISFYTVEISQNDEDYYEISKTTKITTFSSGKIPGINTDHRMHRNLEYSSDDTMLFGRLTSSSEHLFLVTDPLKFSEISHVLLPDGAKNFGIGAGYAYYSLEKPDGWRLIVAPNTEHVNNTYEIKIDASAAALSFNATHSIVLKNNVMFFDNSTEPLYIRTMPVIKDESFEERKSKFLSSFLTTRFNNERWFASGNRLYHTSYNDPTYIGLYNYNDLGESDESVTGFTLADDSTLIVYKDNRVHSVRYGEISEGVYTYIYSDSPNTVGNNAIGGSIVSILTEMPLQISYDGIYALKQLANVQSSGRISELISERINKKWLSEDKETIKNCKTINRLYWTYFILSEEDMSKIYLLDNRTASWYYWELPISILNAFVKNNTTYFSDVEGNLYTLQTSDIINKYNQNKTEYYDDGEKLIEWYWKSQILPMKTINYSKKLISTTFIMSDTDENDQYGLNYKFKAFRKTASQTQETTLSNNINYIVSTTKRTLVPRYNFMQIELSNIEDDLNNNKLRLIGLAFKYVLLEGMI